MKAEKPNELYVRPYLCTFYYEINNQKAPFTDPRVREAIKLGLDRETITNKIIDQGQVVAYGFTPTFIHNGHFAIPEWAKLSAEQRYQRAKDLLAEAGYTAKIPLNLLYCTTHQIKISSKLLLPHRCGKKYWCSSHIAKPRMENQLTKPP